MDRIAPLPKAFLGIWSVYPLLVPFYLMGKTPIPGTLRVESGVPQVADYYLVGIVGLVFLTLPFRVGRSAMAVVGVLIAFVGYTALVNLAWATNLEDLSLLKSTLYYVYDTLLFVTCLVLYATFKDDFLRITVNAVGASVVLQALLSPFAPHPGYSRQAVFFNDENQLGYFCVLAATIFVLGSRRFAIRIGYQLVFYAAVGYLALLSQCRSALLAMAVLTVLSLLGRPLRLLLAVGAVCAVSIVLSLSPPVASRSVDRFVVGGAYDTFATRGYDRILNYPEYILFGAGEGAYERFRSELYGSELHSSFGTLLFCYGIPGTGLFALCLLLMCKGDPRIALFLVPAFVHGTGHQGLRFAFFWTTLAFVCCYAISTTAAPELPGDAPDDPSDNAAIPAAG